MRKAILVCLVLAAQLDSRAQCVSPQIVENGVQLYRRAGAAPSNVGFWKMFKSMFDFWNPPATLPFGRSIGFLAGVSDYKDPHFIKMPGVKNDLDHMCNYLLTNGGFDAVYVARDAAATAPVVNHYMMDFFHAKKNLGPEDRLLFYYSGHGDDDGSHNPYMIFSGATKDQFGDNQVLAVDSWEKWSDRVLAKHAVFIFDACVAGEVLVHKDSSETEEQKEKERVTGLLATLSASGSRTVVTAGTFDQEAWYAKEKSMGYSVFTDSLLKVLQDPYGEPLMSIDEAVEKAALMAAGFTHDKKASPAIPQSKRYDTATRAGRFAFLNPVAKNRGLPDDIARTLHTSGKGPAVLETADRANALELLARMASLRNDPALALYLGVRAGEVLRPSLPPIFESTLADTLVGPRSYAVFRGLEHPARSLTWSPDGVTLASASPEDDTIQLWDVRAGKPARALHHPGVTCVAWNPAGGTLASSGYDDTVRIWDVSTGNQLRSYQLPSSTPLFTGTYGVAWNPQGDKLAALSYFFLQLWDAGTGALTGKWQLHMAVKKVAWSPDGKTLATIGPYATQFWDVATHQLIGSLDNTGSSVAFSDVAWSPEGKRLASDWEDESVQLWDAKTGHALNSFGAHTGGHVNSVIWSPNGDTVATASDDHTIRVWDASSGKLLRTLQGHADKVTEIAWSPDGAVLASASDDHTIRLWQADADQSLRTPLPDATSFTGVVWSPKGRIVAFPTDSAYTLWEFGSDKPFRAFKPNPRYAPLLAAWDPQGETFKTITLDGAIDSWDIKNGRLLRTVKVELPDTANPISVMAWSPDGEILSAFTSGDGLIHIWDAGTGKPLCTIKDYRSLLIRKLVWRPDSKILVVADDKNIRFWDAATGASLRVFDTQVDDVSDLVWSPDGKKLALARSEHSNPALELPIDLNGKKHAPATPQGNIIRVLDAERGERLLEWKAHDAINCLAWSPDGRTLASASNDHTVQLWEPDTGRLKRTLVGHGAAVWSLAWSPDSKILTSVDFDKTIRMWPGDAEELLQQAKNAIRFFTPSADECQRYFGSEVCPVIR